MTLLYALTVGVLFGSGAFLLLKPDLFRVVVGTVLISNAAVLTLLASGTTRGRAPILPVGARAAVSDPLVQALALTAVVIGFAVTALMLTIAYRVYVSEGTVDLDELSEIEFTREEDLERARPEPERAEAGA